MPDRVDDRIDVDECLQQAINKVLLASRLLPLVLARVDDARLPERDECVEVSQHAKVAWLLVTQAEHVLPLRGVWDIRPLEITDDCRLTVSDALSEHAARRGHEHIGDSLGVYARLDGHLDEAVVVAA